MQRASAGNRWRGAASPRRRDRRARSRGQAIVEFALLAPVMLILLAVGVDAGRMFFTWIEVVNAAREGAAYAAGNPTDNTGIATRVNQEANVQVQSGEGSIVITTTCRNTAGTAIACSTASGGNGTGNRVTVQVARTFGFLTPMVGSIFGNAFTLRGSATASVFGLLPNGGESPPGACNDPRVATFTVSAVGQTVYLDGSASAPNSGRCAIASYEWDMGDGANPFPPVVGKLATYTYANPGTYTITLVTRNPGGFETTTRSVTVPGTATASPTPAATAAPTAAPTTPPDPACTMVALFTYEEQGNSGKYNFYGAYTGQPAPEIWYWSFGDGDVGFGQAPSRSNYSGAGPYTVTLTITNGSCSASTSKQLIP